MDSKRLPGKALYEIGNNTLLEWCVKRLKGSKIFHTIIATSSRVIDDPIYSLAKRNNVVCYRGDAFDLNKRLSGCIEKYGLDAFARVNGDSPLISRTLIEQGFGLLEANNYDFVTNLVPRRFPYGISVEIFQSTFFVDTISRQKNPEKEDITKYFYDNLDLFQTGIMKYQDDSDDHAITLTIDDQSDVLFFKKLLTLDPLLFERSYQEVVKLIKENKLTKYQ